MKIEIHIDDRLVAAARRAFTKRRVVTVAAIATFGTAAALALPLADTDLTAFEANKPAVAAEVNGNFEASGRA